MAWESGPGLETAENQDNACGVAKRKATERAHRPWASERKQHS